MLYYHEVKSLGTLWEVKLVQDFQVCEVLSAKKDKESVFKY